MLDYLTIQTLARERQETLQKAARAARTAIDQLLPFNPLSLINLGIAWIAMQVSKFSITESAQPVCCSGAMF